MGIKLWEYACGCFRHDAVQRNGVITGRARHDDINRLTRMVMESFQRVCRAVNRCVADLADRISGLQSNRPAERAWLHDTGIDNRLAIMQCRLRSSDGRSKRRAVTHNRQSDGLAEAGIDFGDHLLTISDGLAVDGRDRIARTQANAMAFSAWLDQVDARQDFA